MMQVTIDRLRERWPAARIAVLTDAPALLRAYFPNAEAITVGDKAPWSPSTLVERAAVIAGPQWVGPPMLAWLRARVWFPQKARGARRRALIRWRALIGDDTPAPPTPPRKPVTRGSFAAVESASLLLVMGGGYLADVDAAQTRRVFNLIEHAHRHAVPVAMVGQGMGPLDDPVLRTRATEVLSVVDVIALREKLQGPVLLESLDVSSDRVSVTGDDAIELAYRIRSVGLGAEIGLCLRVAGYSPISDDIQQTVGAVVRESARVRGAALAPLIIAEYRRQDRRSTLPLVRGYSPQTTPPGKYVAPEVVAERVSRCRVVVTGAYHLAVFALSQGIPVVALTASQYYDDKFLGLCDMFGGGMQVVDLREPNLEGVLSCAIAEAWDSASRVRESLRERARAQVDTSREGFERVYHLVENRRPARR
ncbi:polysaccharide pyruvyl transferase family protein [Gordonia tangerina]|uniref:Polysaccharide pyruvyl transferase family protein n=2 Tax=Gordonia TaxID=2053 RepID=A0ABS9DQC4_9ACTN|nr:polysaccharide pyruvyl transferase family protein [Gordonia tangerina]